MAEERIGILTEISRVTRELTSASAGQHVGGAGLEQHIVERQRHARLVQDGPLRHSSLSSSFRLAENGRAEALTPARGPFRRPLWNRSKAPHSTAPKLRERRSFRGSRRSGDRIKHLRFTIDSGLTAAPVAGASLTLALRDQVKAHVEPPHPRNPAATTYISADSARLAGGLTCLTRGKGALQAVQQRALRAALEHLAHERAARLQHLAGELGGGLGQAHDAQMVGAGVAGALAPPCPTAPRRPCRPRSIAVSRPGAAGSMKSSSIELRRPAIGLHRQEVDGHHLAPAFGRPYRLGGDLGPSAGRGAEIDHAPAGLQEAEPGIDLGKLVAARER